MKESILASKLTKYLRDNGWLCLKNHGSIYASAGTPDIFAWKDSVFLAIELKVPKKKPTPVQLAWIQDINDHGHYAFWADNLPAIKYLLDAICPSKQSRTR